MADERPGQYEQGGRSARRSAPAAGKPRTSPLLLAGRTVAVGTSLAVLATTGFTWYEYKSLSDGMTTSNALANTKKNAPKHLDNSVNLLLIGLDSRKAMDGTDLPGQFVQDELHAGSSSEVGGYNTNSLIMLHIPAGGGKVEAVSIPRDDYVMTYNGDGSEQGMHKIKEAYGIAKAKVTPGLQAKGLKGAQLEAAGREAGREATIQTVQKFLDQPVDHFSEVNLMGFYDIAKAVEPITVCLNHATKDPAMEGQGSGADFKQGLNQLNASQALSFVRQRHNLKNGDLDRTHRQQAFIAAVEYKLKQNGILGDLGKTQQLFGVVQKDVVLDDQWNILDFAQQAPNLTGGNVEFNTLPIQGFKTVGGQDVNTVDQTQIKHIVRQVFGYADAAAPAPTAAASESAPADQGSAPATPAAKASGTVDVYNASTVTGAAGKESQALVAMGFTAGKVGPATLHPKTTTVTYGAGAKDGADQIASHYGVTATASSSVAAGHIMVTLGTGYTAPAGAGGSGPGASSGAPDPSTLPMQGPAVKAGNIPCVD